MPQYTFKKSDGSTVTRRLSFADYDLVKAGSRQISDENGEPLSLVFNPGSVGFVLKDGASGGWMTKVNKESQFRRARSAQMAQKERDHVFKSRLVPNYQGQEAHSWADVRDHVHSTKGAEAASTYDGHVVKERV